MAKDQPMEDPADKSRLVTTFMVVYVVLFVLALMWLYVAPPERRRLSCSIGCLSDVISWLQG